MGPFSNNPPQPPVAPSGSNKLPVPDVEGAPQQVIIAPEPEDNGVKKWLNITLAIAGVMAVVGIAIFGFYVYASNTPSYMLSAAFQNLITSDGQAGTFNYQARQAGAATVQGDFIGYTDPSDPHSLTLTVNAGQDASRVSGTVRLFSDTNYAQAAGLGNLGKLITAAGGNSAAFTPENSVRLASLDGQWFTLTPTDITQDSDVWPQHVVQNGPTSKDVETIEQLYLKHQFIISAQQLADERINGANTMHLAVGVDGTKFNEFLQGLKAAQLKSLHLTDGDVQTIEGSNFLKDAHLEVWINRSDRTFTQIKLARSNDTTLVNFKSEEVATQRQTILRPNGAESAVDVIRELHDIITTKPTAQ